MRYLGGKARVVGRFAPIVNRFSAGRALWEPFCGGLNASVALAARRHVLSDVCPYLIRLVRAVVLEGWLPDLNSVSAESYARRREALDPDDPMTAFLGYGCSFGGKFFGGYVGFVYDAHHLRERNAGSAVVSFPLGAAKSLLAARFALADRVVEVERRDFLDGSRPADVEVVYADPPYRGTTGYETGDFDSDAFWDVCRSHAAAGLVVLVSEANFPGDAEVLWRGGKRRFLRSGDSERLEEGLALIRPRFRRPRRRRLLEDPPPGRR